MNTSAWRIARASTTGTGHIADGRPCQDYALFDWTFSNPNALLIAVADGAGSANLSHIGARAACTGAVLSLKQSHKQLSDPLRLKESLDRAFLEAREAVERAAQDRHVQSRELATTLLVSVVGTTLSGFAQVGDGAIVIDRDGILAVVHWPEQTAVNLTDFITGPPLADRISCQIVHGPVRHVACMSDGVTPLALAYKGRVPHPPFMQQLFHACVSSPDASELDAELTRFLDSDQVNLRTDDDKTIVLAAST